eukprot:6781924-Prymnesium_polylepis.1
MSARTDARCLVRTVYLGSCIDRARPFCWLFDGGAWHLFDAETPGVQMAGPADGRSSSNPTRG